MDVLELLLAKAYSMFGLNEEEGRGERNPFYVEMPARLSEGKLYSRDGSSSTNPFIFLSGFIGMGQVPHYDQTCADSPSISFIVGQYGLGKTELVFQFCNHLLNSSLRPLPVNLRLCRDLIAQIDQRPDAKSFSSLIFAPILSGSTIDHETAITAALTAINDGQIVLILDGLDELVSNPGQHRNFLIGLAQMLASFSHPDHIPEFRVIVTMRLEYLSVISTETEMVNTLIKTIGLSVPVYFLALDYFENTRISAYLIGRLGQKDGNRVFELISQNRNLLEMLRRPLLARIFCDLQLLTVEDKEDLIRQLATTAHPAALIEQFVERASRSLYYEQERLTEYIWDLDRLALTSLSVFSRRASSLTVDDIRSFLVPIAGHKAPKPISELRDTEVMASIHKCPFLRRDEGSQPRASYAHRIFFEYFTAYGMALEFRTSNEENDFISFDELVLNVDMRKLLRDLVGADWYSRTRKSYGLDNPEQWQEPERFNFAQLDRQRKKLLDLMTHPESPPPDIASVVQWFLDIPHHLLHPRYLVYNYEAVAVYLWYRRWDVQADQERKRFGEILERVLEETLAHLKEAESNLTLPQELLIERILDVGYRLRYPWASKIAQESERVFSVVVDFQTRARINTIFEYIHGSIF